MLKKPPYQELCNPIYFKLYHLSNLGGLVGSVFDCWSGGRGFEPHQVQQHSFLEIYHEIFSTVILSLPLIQEGHLSISDERMYTSTG